MRRLLVVLLVIFAAGKALACSCAMPGTPAEALTNATNVFEGKVVAVHDQYTAVRKAWDVVEDKLGRGTPTLDSYMRTHGMKVVFEVTKTWKGSTRKRFVLYTGRGGGDCGFAFKTGQVYVVYAHCGTSYCWTHICTRTRPRAAAADDLRFFATLPQK